MRNHQGNGRRIALAAVGLGMAVALAGCQTMRSPGPRPLTPEEAKTVEALADGRPPHLRFGYERLVREGKRNETLNWLLIADQALNRQEPAVAAEALDQALNGIEAVYADNPQAEKARSVWYAEAEKDFKGEPYERAMAYIDRGMLYLAGGDYENARASFKSALLQDSFAEQERFRQDFASAAWLSGWASHCLGARDLAAEAFAEAKEYRPELQPPPDSADTLVVVEAGNGPSKEAAGQHREVLAYREGIMPASDYAAIIDGKAVPLRLAEDLFFQATTRGGREMDKVLKLKADTQAVSGAVGFGATAVGVGMMTSHDRNTQGAGAMVALAGLLIQAASASMQTAVDTRQWTGVPGRIYLGAGTRTKTPPDIRVDFATGGDAVLVDAQPAVNAVAGRCAVTWYRPSAVRINPKAAPDLPAEAPEAEIGKCQTKTGVVVTMARKGCQAIGGTIETTEPPAQPPPDVTGARLEGPYRTCMMPSGIILDMDHDACRAEGGKVLGRDKILK